MEEVIEKTEEEIQFELDKKEYFEWEEQPEIKEKIANFDFDTEYDDDYEKIYGSIEHFNQNQGTLAIEYLKNTNYISPKHSEQLRLVELMVLNTPNRTDLEVIDIEKRRQKAREVFEMYENIQM